MEIPFPPPLFFFCQPTCALEATAGNFGPSLPFLFPSSYVGKKPTQLSFFSSLSMAVLPSTRSPFNETMMAPFNNPQTFLMPSLFQQQETTKAVFTIPLPFLSFSPLREIGKGSTPLFRVAPPTRNDKIGMPLWIFFSPPRRRIPGRFFSPVSSSSQCVDEKEAPTVPSPPTEYKIK